MDLSIIIVNWNTRDLLARCLKSVFEGVQGLTFEALVVDNASSDDSATMVGERFPQAQLIKSPRNVGFAAGSNLGLRQARGRFLLLLNSDTEVYPGALDVLVRFLETNPRAGAAGARMLNGDGSLQPSCYRTPTLLRETMRLFHLDHLFHISDYAMADWNITRPRRVEVAGGACLLIRRRALEEVGFLDEGYFMYTEETDLCLRLRRHGWQLWWVPMAQVVHFGGQSTKLIPVEMFLQLYKSRVCFFQKHYGRRAVTAYKALLVVTALVRVVVGRVYGMLSGQKEARLVVKADQYLRLLAALPKM